MRHLPLAATLLLPRVTAKRQTTAIRNGRSTTLQRATETPTQCRQRRDRLARVAQEDHPLLGIEKRRSVHTAARTSQGAGP